MLVFRGVYIHIYDESSKVVVHFPCHGCLQIIVWMCFPFVLEASRS